jgi:hypothetical protein
MHLANGRHRNHRRPGLDSLVHPETDGQLLLQTRRVFGKPRGDFLGRRRIPQLLTRADLAVQQLEHQVRLFGQRRMDRLVFFDP